MKGRLCFPPLAGCLSSDVNVALMLSTGRVRAEVGREEAGVGSLHRGRSLRSLFWPCSRVSLELWNEVNLELTSRGVDGGTITLGYQVFC